MSDREPFTAMYTREAEPVLHFLARRTFDPALAADLTAETFALAFRAWPRLARRSEDEVRAWLYTVARRQVSRYLRRGRVERRAVRRLGITVPVLRLRVVEERSYAEVAAELGISEQAVRARVSRGLRALASALAPYRHESEVPR